MTGAAAGAVLVALQPKRPESAMSGRQSFFQGNAGRVPVMRVFSAYCAGGGFAVESEGAPAGPAGRPERATPLAGKVLCPVGFHRVALVNGLRDAFGLPATPVRLWLRGGKNPFAKD